MEAQHVESSAHYDWLVLVSKTALLQPLGGWCACTLAGSHGLKKTRPYQTEKSNSTGG